MLFLAKSTKAYNAYETFYNNSPPVPTHFIREMLQLILKENPLQFKVHLAQKYCFHLNKSLHLFETHCAFLN